GALPPVVVLPITPTGQGEDGIVAVEAAEVSRRRAVVVVVMVVGGPDREGQDPGVRPAEAVGPRGDHLVDPGRVVAVRQAERVRVGRTLHRVGAVAPVHRQRQHLPRVVIDQLAAQVARWPARIESVKSRLVAAGKPGSGMNVIWGGNGLWLSVTEFMS